MGIKGKVLNSIKAICDKPKTAKHAEKQKTFPLRSRSRQVHPLSPLLFHTVLEVVTKAIRKEKEISGIQIGKHSQVISVFRLHDSLGKPKDYQERELELVRVDQLEDYKTNTQKINSVLCTNNPITKK